MKLFTRWTTWAGLAGILAVGAAFFTSGPSLLSASNASIAEPVEVTVYKSPTCGCCSKWVDHMRASGFKVTAHDTSDMQSVKTTLGVPESRVFLPHFGGRRVHHRRACPGSRHSAAAA